MKKFISLCLTLIMLTSMSFAVAEVPWSGVWYEPYDAANTTTVHVAKRYESNSTYVEGESLTDNYLLNYIEESLNAEFVYDYEWDDETYAEKINLMIADGQLPDVFMVDAIQLRDLIEAEMIEDVSAYYEAYASPNLKAAYDNTDGIAWQGVTTKDGAMYALPALDCAESAMQLLWVRTDWLNKLGLDAPSSLEDVEEIALAFRDNDPDGNGEADTKTIMCDANYYNTGGQLGSMNPLFNMFGVYPEYWYYDENGEVIYGSVQPEVKDALTLIHDLIEKGVIEKDFATSDWDQITEAITSNKCGIFWAPWWYAGTVKQMTLEDPSIVWQTYFAPIAEGGTYDTTYGNVSATYCVFRKGVDEATIATTIKAINLQWELDQDQGVSIMPYPEAVYTWRHFPIDMNVNRIDDKRIKADQVWKATHGEMDPAELTGEALETYNSYVKFLDNGSSYEGLSLRDIHLIYHFMVAVLPMVQQADHLRWIAPATFATTETMSLKWATLSKLETDTFTKIMLGELPPEAFDEFVDQWMSLGGEQCIAEIRELVAN